MSELVHASATALARAIRDKEVSAAEVVQAYLQRIDAVNSALNAVVQLCAETAVASRGSSPPQGASHGPAIAFRLAWEPEACWRRMAHGTLCRRPAPHSAYHLWAGLAGSNRGRMWRLPWRSTWKEC